MATKKYKIMAMRIKRKGSSMKSLWVEIISADTMPKLARQLQDRMTNNSHCFSRREYEKNRYKQVNGKVKTWQ